MSIRIDIDFKQYTHTQTLLIFCGLRHEILEKKFISRTPVEVKMIRTVFLVDKLVECLRDMIFCQQ